MSLDVLIIHHPTSNRHRPILLHAMGLLSIAEYLDRHGIRAEVVNLGVEGPDFDVVAYAKQRGVKVVGLSVHWFFQIPDSLDLARRMREANPGVMIVAGGFSASYFAKSLIERYPQVDAVVCGDGEVPFLALCQCILAGEDDWGSVPNLVFLRKGRLVECPFEHVVDERLFGKLCYTRMDLLHSLEAYRLLPFYPTKRYEERFPLGETGIFQLELSRGCPWECALCGGSHEVQKKLSNRRGYVFRPVDSVIGTIKAAVSAGFRIFYICQDPDPRGRYFLELFRRIREEQLDVVWMFECWGLPIPEFVDACAETFEDSLIVLSVESADEEVRRQAKGPLHFTNRELMDCIEHIDRRGIACQLFFGFFLPGDSRASVMDTRRFAHDLKERAEVLYLAYSTDPGSLAACYPERYGLDVELHTLDEYIEALQQPRMSSNLLAHRPRGMSPDEAENLISLLNLDQFLHRVLPNNLKAMRDRSPDRVAYHELVEKTLEALIAERSGEAGLLRVTPMVSVMQAMADNEWLKELIEYEAWPYVLLEQHTGALGAHYTSTCREVPPEQFQRTTETLASRRRFRYASYLRAVGEGQAPESPKAEEKEIELVVNPDGAFAVQEIP